MHKFQNQLCVGTDTSTSRAMIGLLVSGLAPAAVFIRDPFGADREAFGGNTPESLGVTLADDAELKRLNEALDTAVDSALDAGCLAIQEALGETDGGFAGMYFSGDAGAAVRDVLANYLVAQANEVYANAEADEAASQRSAPRN